MINIADNPILRGQVKKGAPQATEQAEAPVNNAPPAEPQAYPAKSLVLDGGRYYASKPEK